MKNFQHFIAMSVLSLLTACGGGDTFRITGEIPGTGTQNLNVVYYGDGAFHSTRTASIDGKFMFDGNSRAWTTVYFFNNSRTLIGMVIIKNGENVEARFEPGAIVLTGTKPSELLSEWLGANSEALANADYKAVNASIADFVSQHRDNVASTVILTNYFDVSLEPQLADSLFQLIDSKSRPTYMAEGWSDQVSAAMDSTLGVLPDTLFFIDVKNDLQPILTSEGTLILYSPDVRGRNQTIDRTLKSRLKKQKLDSLSVRFIEINREITDTAMWHRDFDADNLPWRRMWHPFNSASLPWQGVESFIVADSTGTIVYSGSDMEEALATVNL